MFGIIISGRQVVSNPTAITQTQYAFRVPPTPSFSHIVVFLLPGTQLPDGTAATVFVQIPPSQDFKLLGGIGPGKESAIFKVSGLKTGGSGAGPGELYGDAMTDDSAQSNTNADVGAPAGGDIVVGISIEPAAQVEAQISSLKRPQVSDETTTALVRQGPVMVNSVTTKVLAQRIIGNAFNFLASFGSDTVPLKAFQDWWTKFEKRVDLDPSFLEREQQG